MKLTGDQGDFRIFYGVLLSREGLRKEMVYCEYREWASVAAIVLAGDRHDLANTILLPKARYEAVEEIRTWLADTASGGATDESQRDPEP